MGVGPLRVESVAALFVLGGLGAALASASSAEAPLALAEVAADESGAPPDAESSPNELSADNDELDNATPRALDARVALLAGLDPSERSLEDDTFVSPLDGGRRAVLTVDPPLQEHVESMFQRYEVPYASVVAIEPSTGRVLAYVSHSSANPDAGDLALDPTPPTASVFKVVTGAALIDSGVSAQTRVCYSGGGSRLRARHLQDHDSDNQCATLSEAMGGSINAVFAKLADRNLDGPTLERYASAFGFGHALPFDLPTQASPMDVPDDALERARTAAGFWHMHMSPLHGALIAATIANDGQMPRAAIVERVEDAHGEVLLSHEPSVFRSVVPRHTAREVGMMMRETVAHGTARRSFRDPEGRPFLPGVVVAGKTGTLSAERPYRGYTWFIGFAPADAPTIAVAALVVNTPRWRIKAAYAGRETLRHYLMR